MGIVVMDNHPAHQITRVKGAIEKEAHLPIFYLIHPDSPPWSSPGLDQKYVT